MAQSQKQLNSYKPMNIMNVKPTRVADKNQSFAVSLI